MGESERERDGEEGEDNAANRRRRKESSFIVESKVFEIVLEERKGQLQVIIVEKKRGASSWVRLGSESLGFFVEGLNHCIKDKKEGKWGRGWKEKGRSYSLMQGINRAGWFLRLGVVDSEKKSFSIFIPKGKGDKGGWVTMAEKLLQMEGALGRKANKQEARVVGKSTLERSYAEVVKRPSWRVNNSVRVKVRREETLGNLRKQEHCIVVSRKSSAAGGEDLEKLGRLLANSWGLKGELGLARLEKNRVLLEFEALEEARRVLSSGKRLLGGLQLGLEHWNLRTDCWVEEELRNEVWVKIVGLPISLWNLTILRRVGKECGGFVAIDPQTETLRSFSGLESW